MHAIEQEAIRLASLSTKEMVGVVAARTLQKSMDFTPLLPSAGPTGGLGLAWPAPTMSLTIWSARGFPFDMMTGTADQESLELCIYEYVCVCVTCVGSFRCCRWRKGNLERLQNETGLGRRFGELPQSVVVGLSLSLSSLLSSLWQMLLPPLSVFSAPRRAK